MPLHVELHRADSWWVFTRLDSVGFPPLPQHVTLVCGPEPADTLSPIAIMVLCLGSFRALFVRERLRAKIPHGEDNLRKLFLPAAIRNNGQITTLISASSDNETKLLTTSSDESNASVIPPDKVHVRREINQSISPSDLEHGKTEIGEDYPRGKRC